MLQKIKLESFMLNLGRNELIKGNKIAFTSVIFFLWGRHVNFVLLTFLSSLLMSQRENVIVIFVCQFYIFIVLSLSRIGSLALSLSDIVIIRHCHDIDKKRFIELDNKKTMSFLEMWVFHYQCQKWPYRFWEDSEWNMKLSHFFIFCHNMNLHGLFSTPSMMKKF